MYLSVTKIITPCTSLGSPRLKDKEEPVYGYLNVFECD